MGSYGIGVERGIAAVVEACHDDNGIVWPVSVAPYEVVITVVRPDDEATLRTAEEIYETLGGMGVEVLLDDREERPGVKFADSELIGIPFRVTIGPRGVERGVAELTIRKGLLKEEVSLSEVASHLFERVTGERYGI